jgi:uncharacterized protein
MITLRPATTGYLIEPHFLISSGDVNMKRILLIFIQAVLILSMQSAFAAEEKLTVNKTEDIKKLLEVTGALAIGRQMSDFFIQNYEKNIKQARPDIPAEMFDVMREEVDAVMDEAMPTYIEMIVPLYHKYFTHQDVKEMLKFYSTPLGQKTIRVLPALMQDSMSLGQRWGEAMGPIVEQRILKRFKEEGVDLSA